jgi:hypothetical protein
MGIVEFTWGAMAGGVAYDGVKIILAKSYDKLKDFFDNGKKEEFNSHLETILSVSEGIKAKLEELQNNTEINDSFEKIIDSNITVNGDSKKIDNSFKDIKNSTINI